MDGARESTSTSSVPPPGNPSTSPPASTCGSGSSVVGGGGGDSVLVPVVLDELTFDNRQALRLREIERRLIEDTRRKRHDWERDVEKMREEFLTLYPCDEPYRPPPSSSSAADELPVGKRRGSTDVLDSKQMKTMFLEYPDAGRRYKLRFNVSHFDPERLRVVTDGERIIVRGSRLEENEHGVSKERDYERKIEKPKEVDHSRLKSFLTTDGILIIEAPLPPKSLNLRKANHANSSPQRSSHGGSSTSVRSSSPANIAIITSSSSAAAVQPSTSNGTTSAPSPTRERFCLPVFFDDSGRRKMSLTVDIGLAFAAKEITVLIIKENRIQIKGRHEERTAEKLCKRKYTKEFELPEKIETYSLRGGLTVDGKLIVSALGKGHAGSLNKVTAGELIEDDINARAENQACNVLDLSTFPPTTPQLIASSYNN